MYRIPRRSVRASLSVGLVAAAAVLGTALPAQAVGGSAGPGGAVGSTSPTTPSAPVASSTDLTLAATTSEANARIASLIASRRQDPVLGGDTTIRVFDTATGHTIYSLRSTQSFRVASNTKIVTAATALQTMGPSRTFPTTVVLGRGSNVYIVGGGDPLLTSSTLSSLAATAASALRARGLVHVRVYLDDTLFSPWSFPAGFDSRCPEDHGARGYCITPVRALTYDRHSHADNAKDAAAYFTSRLNAASGVAASYAGRPRWRGTAVTDST